MAGLGNDIEIKAIFTADTSGFAEGAAEVEASSKAIEESTAGIAEVTASTSEETIARWDEMGRATLLGVDGWGNAASSIGDASQSIIQSTATMGGGMDEAAQSFEEHAKTIEGSMGGVASEVDGASQTIAQSTSSVGAGIEESAQVFEESSKGIGDSMTVIGDHVESSSQAVEKSTANIGGGIKEASGAFVSFEEAGKSFTTTIDGVPILMDDTAKSFWGLNDASEGTLKSLDGASLSFEDMVKISEEAPRALDETSKSAEAASAAFQQQVEVQSQLATAESETGASASEAGGGFNLLSMQGMMAVQMIQQFVMMAGQAVTALANQQQQVLNTAAAFATLTGDATKAAEAINNLNSSAEAHDFGKAAIDGAVQHMMMLGESSDQATKEVTLVADGLAAVGGSAQQITPVIDQLHNIKDQSLVTTQEMNQLVSQGLPAWKLLADGMGISISQAQERVKAGAVSGSQAFNVIMGELGQYGDAADKQSQSLNAEWTRFGDNMGKAFGPIAELLSQDLEQINELIEGTSKASAALQVLETIISTLYGGGGFISASFLTGHASGIIDSPIGHFAMVGESGPELMYVPQGASIFPSGQSSLQGVSALPSLASAMSGGSSATIYVTTQLVLDSRVVAEQTLPHIAPLMYQQFGIRGGA